MNKIIKALIDRFKPKPHKCPFYFYGNCGPFEDDCCPYNSRNEHTCWLYRMSVNSKQGEEEDE